MTITSRILAALLLAGASTSLVACEEDDKAPSPGGNKDSGSDVDAGSEPDEDGSTPEADGGTTEGDSGTPVGDDCPTHPNVTKSAKYCVIKAPKSAPLTEPLTVAPVKDKTWVLSEGVFIGEDVGGGASPAAGKKSTTLTIKAGTTLVGESALSFLSINRGSKIDAQGTAESPIVFTGVDRKKPGEWGGVIINGRSLHNQGTNVVGEAETGEYAGPDAADNSGVLRYVRIEFGGGKQNPTNELNGLALQGVGSGTELDYLHIHANDDDGIEFFGGTVNASHVVVTAFGDDGIDWTSGWTGKLQYAIVQQWSRVSSSDPNGIEADNDQMNNAATPVSSPTLSNVTLIGGEGVAAGHGLVLRRGTKAALHNLVVTNFGASCISVRDALTQSFAGGELALKNSGVLCTTKYDAANAATGALLFDAAGAANVDLADKDALYTDAYSRTPNFEPKAGSPVLTGGVKPADAFFEEASFIGARGAEDWTAGAWVQISPITE